jgi:hypothetical protein
LRDGKKKLLYEKRRFGKREDEDTIVVGCLF